MYSTCLNIYFYFVFEVDVIVKEIHSFSRILYLVWVGEVHSRKSVETKYSQLLSKQRVIVLTSDSKS
jgi:hypothetical protein